MEQNCWEKKRTRTSPTHAKDNKKLKKNAAEAYFIFRSWGSWKWDSLMIKALNIV